MSFQAFNLTGKTKKLSTPKNSAPLAEFAEPTYDQSEPAELSADPTQREAESDALQVGKDGLWPCMKFSKSHKEESYD